MSKLLQPEIDTKALVSKLGTIGLNKPDVKELSCPVVESLQAMTGTVELNLLRDLYLVPRRRPHAHFLVNTNDLSHLFSLLWMPIETLVSGSGYFDSLLKK